MFQWVALYPCSCWDSAGLKSTYELGSRNGGGGSRRVEREEMESGFYQSTLYTYMKFSNNK